MENRRRPGLTTAIFIGLAPGAAAGILLHCAVPEGKVRDVLFIDGTFYLIRNGSLRLMQMLVVPLAPYSLVCGNTSVGDTKRLGKIGIKTLGLYSITTALTITTTILTAQVTSPGVGLDPYVSETAQVTIGEKEGLADMFLAITPINPVRALADGNMLPVILFVLIVGATLIGLRETVQTTRNLFSRFNDVIVQVIVMAIGLIPYGVFCLTARTFFGIGFSASLPLFKYMARVTIVLAVQGLMVYMAILKGFMGLSPVKFLKKFLSVMGFAFFIMTSNVTISMFIDTLHRRMGMPRCIPSFTILLETTADTDGVVTMQGAAVVFASQVSGIRLSVTDYLTVILTATLAFVGTVSMPGVGLITLSMVSASVGLPVEAIVLITGTDRISDMSRAAANITEDAVRATVVALQDGGMDRAVFENTEAGRDEQQATDNKQRATLRNFLMCLPLDFIPALCLVTGASTQEGNMNIPGSEVKSKEEQEQGGGEYPHRTLPGSTAQEASVEQQLREKLLKKDEETVMFYYILARDAMTAGNDVNSEEVVGRVSKKQRVFKLAPAMLEKVREVMEDNQ